MTTKATVNDFLAQRTLAVVGVSRDPKAFANGAYKLEFRLTRRAV
jgi:hypothetical protein